LLKIRPEKKSDQAAIYKVNKLAFGQDDESRLVDKLRESESYVDGLSMVAENMVMLLGMFYLPKFLLNLEKKILWRFQSPR